MPWSHSLRTMTAGGRTIRGSAKQQLLEEIIGHLKAATTNAVALIRAAMTELASNPPEASPAHSALQLAIWTNRDHISAATRQKYGVLLDKYFDA
jgi:5'-methylthioadenosine phosphorylase